MRDTTAWLQPDGVVGTRIREPFAVKSERYVTAQTHTCDGRLRELRGI